MLAQCSNGTENCLQKGYVQCRKQDHCQGKVLACWRICSGPVNADLELVQKRNVELESELRRLGTHGYVELSRSMVSSSMPG